MILERIFRNLTVSLGVLVAILSLTPDPAVVTDSFDPGAWIAAQFFGRPEWGDKVSHFLAYAALAGSAGIGFGPRFSHTVTAAGLVVFGALIEVLQAMGGTREGDLIDILANAAGVATGLLGAVVVTSILRVSRVPA